MSWVCVCVASFAPTKNPFLLFEGNAAPTKIPYFRTCFKRQKQSMKDLLWSQVIAQAHMFVYALCACVGTHRYMSTENKKNSVYNFNNGDNSIHLIFSLYQVPIEALYLIEFNCFYYSYFVGEKTELV